MSRVKIPSTVDRLPETLSLISCIFHSASLVLIWNILEWSLNNSKLNHHSYFFEALNWISVAAHSFFWKDWIRKFLLCQILSQSACAVVCNEVTFYILPIIQKKVVFFISSRVFSYLLYFLSLYMQFQWMVWYCICNNKNIYFILWKSDLLLRQRIANIWCIHYLKFQMQHFSEDLTNFFIFSKFFLVTRDQLNFPFEYQ